MIFVIVSSSPMVKKLDKGEKDLPNDMGCSPFFILVRDEKLVHLTALEFQFVLVVLRDRNVVRDGIVLGRQELLEGQHGRLGQSIRDGRWMMLFSRTRRAATTTIRAQSSVGIVRVSVAAAIHSVVVHSTEASAHWSVTSILKFRAHPLHRRRRVTRWSIIVISRAISKRNKMLSSVIGTANCLIITCRVLASALSHRHQLLGLLARLGTCLVACGHIRHQNQP